nr:MAG TPA: hypothetical protein [Caudoviricetes sp.]
MSKEGLKYSPLLIIWLRSADNQISEDNKEKEVSYGKKH